MKIEIITRWLIPGLILSVTSVLAQQKLPVLHAGDESFTNVVVYSTTPTDLYFSHAGGMGNAKLKDLDATLQKRFNYNPTNAAKAAQAQAEATRSYYMAKAAEKPPVVVPEPEIADEEALVITNPLTRLPGISLDSIKAKRFLGTQAPKLTVEKWLTPAPVTPGKFVLVDFWATWCGPCRSVIPKLNDMQAKFNDRLVIVGLSDESESAVRLMKSPVMNYSVAIDTKARTKREVEVTAIPHAMLIDPQGNVRFEGNPHGLTVPLLEELLNAFAN